MVVYRGDGIVFGIAPALHPFFSGGHISSNDVWVLSSQLNVWIKVACLQKGRWRHKMATLQGKVGLNLGTTFTEHSPLLLPVSSTMRNCQCLVVFWLIWR